MIDVHVIERPNANQEWVSKAIRSIPSHLCKVHHILEGSRSIAENRQIGFKLGDAEYVSFVDDDDYALPGAFEECFKFLENNPSYDAVGTLENKLLESGEVLEPDMSIVDMVEAPGSMTPWMAFHHIWVIRRDSLTPHLSVMDGYLRPERKLLKELYSVGKKAKLLSYVGYTWRIHKDSYIQSLISVQ